MISTAGHPQTSRRPRTAWLAALLLALTFPLNAASAPAELSYTAEDSPLHLPEGVNFGEVAGMAINSHKHVIVFSRGENGGGPAFGPAAAQVHGPTPANDHSLEPGFPWAICISPDQTLWVADAVPGRIYGLTLQGQVTGYFGRSGRGSGQFGWIHELACPDAHPL